MSDANREQGIIASNRMQVEERRRARYEQQGKPGNTIVYDKADIKGERKDLVSGGVR